LIAVKGVAYPATAPNPETARALMKFLTTPDAVKVLKKNGLEPG
jgi:ABC-type molybdate transport system substrate-binding protein